MHGRISAVVPPSTSGLYTPAETARIFGVGTATINRWAKSGKLPSVLTPGGHRRFRAADINARIITSTEAETASLP